MVLVDGKGTPIGIHVDSASPSEVKTSFAYAEYSSSRNRSNEDIDSR